MRARRRPAAGRHPPPMGELLDARAARADDSADGRLGDLQVLAWATCGRVGGDAGTPRPHRLTRPTPGARAPRNPCRAERLRLAQRPNIVARRTRMASVQAKLKYRIGAQARNGHGVVLRTRQQGPKP